MFRALLCSTSGGQNCIIQHLLSSHSVGEVYILILPGFGIISHIICHERGKKEAFGNLGIIFAIKKPALVLKKTHKIINPTRMMSLMVILYWAVFVLWLRLSRDRLFIIFHDFPQFLEWP